MCHIGTSCIQMYGNLIQIISAVRENCNKNGHKALELSIVEEYKNESIANLHYLAGKHLE